MPVKWLVEFVAECIEETECVQLCLTHSACETLNCKRRTNIYASYMQNMLIFTLTHSLRRRTDDQTLSRSFRFHNVPKVVYVTELKLLLTFCNVQGFAPYSNLFVWHCSWRMSSQERRNYQKQFSSQVTLI